MFLRSLTGGQTLVAGLGDVKKRKTERVVPIPRLTPPRQRRGKGGLYSAKLLFEHWITANGQPAVRRTCEERLILLQATSARLALREAKAQARASQWRSRNSHGNPWHFRFIGVLDLLHLGIECQPNEVWYDIKERVTPMERRRTLVPPERCLNAIRNELAAQRGRR
jgi:hypothetical protein